MKIPPKQIFHRVLFSCLLLVLGFTAGRMVSTSLYQQDTPVTIFEDTKEGIPTVHIRGIENGRVSGSIEGDARVMIGDQAVSPNQDGSFDISAGSFFINYVSVIVPDGMHFVASKNGKKYYPVTSGNGERILPANRIYFKTAVEAEENGFQP